MATEAPASVAIVAMAEKVGQMAGLWTVNFPAYLGPAIHGQFLSEERARDVFREACKMRNDAVFSADEYPAVFFTFADDFGISISLNLCNHMIVFSGCDLSAKSAAALNQANDAARIKHDTSAPAGFHGG